MDDVTTVCLTVIICVFIVTAGWVKTYEGDGK